MQGPCYDSRTGNIAQNASQSVHHDFLFFRIERLHFIPEHSGQRKAGMNVMRDRSQLRLVENERIHKAPLVISGFRDAHVYGKYS